MVSRIWIPTLAAGALALRLAAAAAAATAVAAPAGADLHPPAERLPIRVYTIDDGLAGDEIHAVLQDSRGFLWIATESGLSRFDGTRFVEYDPRQGLPSPNVTALAEAAGGALLAGTTGGLARLDPGRVSTAPAFSVVPDASGRLRHRVTALLADGGTVWAADPAPDGGLFRLQPAKTGAGSAMSTGSATSAGSAAEVRLPSGAPVSWVTSLAPDGGGGLWVGERSGLLHRLADGRWIACPVRPLPAWEGVGALLVDGQRRVWILSGRSLYVLAPGPAETGQPAAAGRQDGGSLLERAAAGHCRQAGPAALRLPEAPGEVCRFDAASGLAGLPGPEPGRDRPWGGMLQTRDGKIWIAIGGALNVFDGRRFQGYTSRNGLLQDELAGLAEDRDGNLWVGTRSHGLMRIAHNGFVAYAAPAAPGGVAVAAILEDSRANLYVWGSDRGQPKLFHLDGGQLLDVTPAVIARAGYPGRGRHQVLAADAGGGLLLGSAGGIWRFSMAAEPAAQPRAPRQHWPAPAEMGELVRLFQDSRGAVWVSSLGKQSPAAPAAPTAAGSGAARSTYLARWDRVTGRYSPVAAVDRLGRGPASAFAEDPYGNVWIGFSSGGLARLRGEAVDLFAPGADVPAGAINDLFVDSRQRLWAATAYGGVIRLDDLNAPRPRTAAYTTAQGLSSDRVLCVTEDRRGTIYLGHGKGIDRLDPQTGRIRTLTTADGLPSSVVDVAYRARDGSLWFGTPVGPARYLPDVPHAEAPPPVFLSGLRIGGVPVPVPALGVQSLGALELPAGHDEVEVRFTGISFAYGAGLRYQYRLEGSAADWSEPQVERSVLLGNLAPGDYRFLVRAVTPDSVVSPVPASLSFTLPRPLWQRWWFLALAGAATALLAWSLHHARLSRLVELERVRARIAADLHDDLSSSLSRISILSELGRRRIADPAALEATTLDQIGETARELMETIGDIVWAIDARRDDLESLLARIRRFAGDLLEARGVSVLFAAPEGAAGISLRPEAKRELYLVLKEAIHNAARHARAKEVRIEVAAARGELVAEVRDDGVGFAAGSPEAVGTGGTVGAASGDHGHGLRNLRTRAAKLGANLSVDSAPGAGTRVRLSLRL
ncbi:MAG TPA: two-component regulator propeller domain-containing protein [Thermoanaerobaculia bacterium]|nr:two-component regulator propeller domain-containing protein [Thermoanaerobaculia bacterium]